MFTMENCFYVLTSQAARCLKDASILPRDKQRLKQELSSELVRPARSAVHCDGNPASMSATFERLAVNS